MQLHSVEWDQLIDLARAEIDLDPGQICKQPALRTGAWRVNNKTADKLTTQVKIPCACLKLGVQMDK